MSWPSVSGRVVLCLLVLAPPSVPCKGAAAPARQGQPPPAPTIQDVLGWLPADTETITAAVGPFAAEIADDPPDKKGSSSLRQLLESLFLGPVTDAGNAALFKQVRGRTVLLAVEGMRHFTDPANIGVGSYAGYHVLVFQQGGGPARSEVAKVLQAGTKTTCKIGEHTVYVFAGQCRRDVWTHYVTQPQDDLLLCATDRRFLEETLSRRAQRAKVEAAPTRMEGWQALVGTARFWALRRGDPEAPRWGFPFQEAVFTFAPGRQRPKIRYFTKSKGASQAIRRSWTGWSEDTILTPTTRTIRPGVIEATFQLDRKAGWYFLFGLLGLLGHRIAC